MGMAICLSCLKLWLPHASSLHLCISASLHGPIWIDILNILPPFIPHSGCCKASVGVTSRASSSCHGMSRTKHHQICKNKTRILEAAPQPYHVIPKGWYQLRFSGSDIQLYILLQILSNASSHRFAIQQYNLCSSQLGGILALVLVLNTESGRPSFPSFPPQLDCLEKSLVGLLEQCGVTQVSPQVVPCRSIIFPAQWQRMAIRLGPSFPQRPRRGSPIQTCGSWTLHCTLGLAKDAYDWADWEACDWEGRHHDSAHSTHGNQCGFVAWTLHGF